MNWEVITEAFLLGAALAADAAAASAALAAAGRWTFNWRKILITAAFFGGFQLAMPLAGFYGSSFAGELVSSFGKYIAGILLIGIGGKMFFDSQSDERKRFSIQQLLVLSLATSMDAFLVGVSFQFQHRSNIFVDVIIIGIVTFLICIVGSLLGRWSGKLLGKNCIIPGALILVLLGIKVIFTAG